MSERHGYGASRAVCVFYAFCALCAAAFATEGVYQTPPVLYVGDIGTLVYPLDALAPLPEGEVFFSEGLPETDDVIIRRITLDRRGRRAIIEFQAFRTGAVPLPPVPFGDTELRGLRVNVASILDAENGSLTLSPEAGPLAAPGTLWAFAVLAAFAVIALAVIVLLYAKGESFLENARGALRARLLLRRINSGLSRLGKRLRKGQITENEAMYELSGEIRDFLSRFWMTQCYALSAEEFLHLEIPPPSGDGGGKIQAALYGFFKRCDEIRFCGASVTPETVNAVRTEAETLVNGGWFSYSNSAFNANRP